MATGTQVSVDSGAPTIEDMAINLPRICRFAGNGWEWFPVGLHTFVVCDLLPGPLKAYGLVHDGSEGYGNDVPKPAKTQQVSDQEDRIFDRILSLYNLPQLNTVQQQRLKFADECALWGEVWTFGPPDVRPLYPHRLSVVEDMCVDYARRFPPLECISRTGSFGVEFKRRWNVYRVMAETINKPGMPGFTVPPTLKIWP